MIFKIDRKEKKQMQDMRYKIQDTRYSMKTEERKDYTFTFFIVYHASCIVNQVFNGVNRWEDEQ